MEKYLVLIKNELNLALTEQLDGTHYYHKNDVIVTCLVKADKGEDERHMLRADFHEYFDRWSNCWFEEFFSNEVQLKKALSLLKDFQLNKEELIVDYESDN